MRLTAAGHLGLAAHQARETRSAFTGSAATRRWRADDEDPGTGRGARFGREHRLRTAAEFARVRQKGRSVSGVLVTLGYARREALTEPDGEPALQPVTPLRVGFTVGKRVGGAVIRNRVRRRLREAMRRRLWRLAPGWDLVVVARAAAATAPSTALAQELDALLDRAKVLTAGSERPDV